jgi:hypothetical protein
MRLLTGVLGLTVMNPERRGEVWWESDAQFALRFAYFLVRGRRIQEVQRGGSVLP